MTPFGLTGGHQTRPGQADRHALAAAARDSARDRVGDRAQTAVGESGLADSRHETARERLDRNLSELNGEMRVVITGVQVLFAFLLVAPFDSGFARLDSFERDVYFVTLLLVTLAAVCTIGPAAQHRVLFRRDDKAYIVLRADRLALAGLALLAMAMSGALLLVATYLFGRATGIATAATMGCVFGQSGFALPMRARDSTTDRGRAIATQPIVLGAAASCPHHEVGCAAAADTRFVAVGSR